jgi:hypothetical protein
MYVDAKLDAANIAQATLAALGREQAAAGRRA